MTKLQYPENESQRIEALQRYDILDTPADGNFDRITRIASLIFNVPIALITLVDSERIWFKSAYGLGIAQINRDPGLCASAILSNDPYIVEDALEDVRTLSNPLVAGEFGLRFYAAAPLQTEDNYNLGSFCIIDKTPRTMGAPEVEILKQLAALVMDEMNMRLAVRNAVCKINNITADLSSHLKGTITRLQNTSAHKPDLQVIPYLEASQIYLENVQHQLSSNTTG